MILSVEIAKSGKINLFVNEEFCFSLPAGLWYSLPFRDGAEITETELAELKAKADSFYAYESALRLLSNRAHGEKELETKLKMKYSAAAAHEAVQKCKDAGLIDDAVFARLFADELHRRKAFSAQRIIFELEKRGIDRNTAESAVFALDIDEDSAIIRMLEKLNYSPGCSEKEKSRIIRRLLSLGYSYAAIRRHIFLTGD